MMRHRYNIFVYVSRKEYLEKHPDFIRNVLEASIKNAGAINLLARQHDYEYITGFNFLYPQLVEDLGLYHKLAGEEHIKILEMRQYKGRMALVKKKRDYFVKVFEGPLPNLDAWIQKIVWKPGSQYLRFRASVPQLRSGLFGTIELDRKRKYRGPDASGKDRPDVKILQPQHLIKTQNQKEEVVLASAILRKLADSKEHSLPTFGPQVQQRLDESQQIILGECEYLRGIGAVIAVTSQTLRITEYGIGVLDLLNEKLLRHVKNPKIN